MYYRISSKPPETVIKCGGSFAYWKSPYCDMDFVDTLKASIPATDRRWYAEREVWAVRVQHVDALADLVEKFYFSRPGVEVVQ